LTSKKDGWRQSKELLLFMEKTSKTDDDVRKTERHRIARFNSCPACRVGKYVTIEIEDRLAGRISCVEISFLSSLP
jgi:hypothetical protein